MAFAAAALTCGCLPVFLLSALSTSVTADLGLGPAALGYGVSAFFLAAALASIPGGRFADRFGARKAFRAGLMIAAGSGLMLVWFASDAWSLAGILFVGGASLGLIDTGGARAIASCVRAQRHGIAFGVKEASIPIASLLAGISVPAIGLQVGWRWAFVLGAVLAVVVAVLVPRSLDAGSVETPGPEDPVPNEFPQPNGGRRVENPVSHSGVDPRARWALTALAVAAALGAGASESAAIFLVPGAVSAGGSASTAGLILAVGSATSVAIRLFVGRLADRRFGGELRIVSCLLVIGAFGVALLVGGDVRFMVPGAVLALGAGWGWTGLAFLSAVRMHPERPARASGAVLAGLGLGGAAGPALFGLIVDNAAYTTAWTFAGVAMLTAAASTWLAQMLRRDSRHARPRPA